MDEAETLTVPSFTVLKNGSILKNIILLNKSPSSSQDEQILLVGRHPHCNITLGHPSISRYHLRIHSNPQSRSISVFDLSSVHGTWVCGMRVKPGVFVRLKEGDTVKIGGSSRLYELHWVPVNSLGEGCDVYAAKQGGSENQDVIDDTCSLDDDMESLEWPLEDKVQDSPFKKLDPLICSVSEYLTSSGDDTEAEHSCSSNESNQANKNGQVFSAILDQPEFVVVQTVPAVHDFNSMSELEPQIGGVNKEDTVSELVMNCSKSSSDATDVEPSSPRGTGNAIADVFAPASAHLPLVVLEAMSETEVSDSLDKSEDQLNWLRDNVSDEFELQSGGIIKEDPVSVSNCLKSLCDDAEVEHSSPKKTGNINGELFTAVSIQSPFVLSEAISEAEVSESLDKSEDQSNWLRDNISNEFEQFVYGLMKKDLISVATFDALNKDITRSDEIIMGKEIEQVNEQEIDNWLRDNISNEIEQLSNGTVKDGMVSVPLSEDIKICENDASDKEIARNDEIDRGNENEPLIQQEIDTGCVKGDDDGSFTPIRAGSKEFNVGCVFEQMNQIKTTGESASVILYDGLDNEVDNSNEFGQLSHSAMKNDLLSVDPFDVVKTHEKDVLSQDIARSDEIELGNQSEWVIQQEIDNGSISAALFNDNVKGDEEEPFVADMAGAEDVNLGCEFEQMHTMDESASVILFDGLDNEVDMGIKFELIDDEIMKKESVFEAIPDGIKLDQKQTLTPVSRVKEVCMNLEARMNGSVPTNLFDRLDENEFEFFTPDKENKNPEARSGKSLQKGWKKAVSPIINEKKDFFGFSKSLLTNVDESKNVFTVDDEKFVPNSRTQRSPNTTDKVDPFAHCEEVLFSSEKETKSGQVEMEASCNSINYPETVQKVTDSCQNVLGGAKKRWTMVVDTSTLLHDESLKQLKLLEGLKGTRLFIPKTVLRELMDLKSQYAFYKRNTVKASLALQWIDESMVTTSWWIHMDDEILHHPQAETEVLHSALRLCKEITDQKIIILSNDLTLKIKAMAEGVMCEEAEEFRRSLVNPFSERFMWVGSSARGLTWSCVYDVVKNYHGCTLLGSCRLKGLKLLAH